jgi:hypothetical protein
LVNQSSVHRVLALRRPDSIQSNQPDPESDPVFEPGRYQEDGKLFQFTSTVFRFGKTCSRA